MNERELSELEPLGRDPALPGELRDALVGYRAVQPSAEASARLFASVERELDVPTTPVSRLRVYLGLSVLAALIAVGVELSRDASTPVASAPPAEPVAAEAQAEGPPAAAAPQAIAKLERPRTKVERAPAESERPRVLVAARPAGESAQPEQLDMEGELALLTRAKRSLALDPTRAYALSEEHAARYPRGLLGEEREVIAIEALARSGALEPARQRAEAFRAAHPRSTHLARLEVILAAP